MSQGVGTWTPPARMDFDSFRVDHAHGRPLLVRVRELKEQHASRRFPTPKDKVVVDVVDLAGADNTGASPRVFVGCMWGADAVVDGLRDYVGDGIAYPVIPRGQQSQGGNTYTVLDPMEGPALEWATAWYNANPNAIDEARDAKMQAARAAQAAQHAESGQAGPVQPQAPQVPQLVGLGAAQAQAPVAQAPATPVQQFAPAMSAAAPVTQAPAPAGPSGDPFQAPAQAPITSDQAAAALAALNAPAS